MQNKQSSRPLLFQYSSNQSPTSAQYSQLSQISNMPGFQHQDSQGSKNQVLASPLQITCDLSDQEQIHQFQNHTHNTQRFEVYMRCVTWGRDSHGLFDYESRQIAKRNIKSYTGGKIIRLNNDVEFISKQSSANEYGPTAKPLIVVHERNGKFLVENDTLVAIPEDEGARVPHDEDVNNKMFIVVRNLKTTTTKSDYRLKKGDIIKLGRIKFKVKDFRSDSAPANLDMNKRASCSPVKRGGAAQTLQQDDEYWVGGDDFSEEAIEIDCGVVDSTQNDIQCKVCWSNEQSPTNPLLNSCKCDGSVRFIHYECLKHWLKQKMQKKEENNLISYSWKQFECEICKKPYPYVFKSNGRKYRLVDVDVPEEKKFLWLESLTFEKNSSRMVHLIMPDAAKSTFKLGRGHDSEVRVSDISVSRCHAILKYDQNDHQYYLEDNLSKFGTLILAKSAIELDVNQTQAVQIGRSVISFTVKHISHVPSTKAQSPQRVTYHNSSQKIEEVLRIKIEETNQKINRIMSSNGCNSSQNTGSHNPMQDMIEQPDFNMYLQQLQSAEQQRQQIDQHNCNDPRYNQYNLAEYNFEEREKLNHTLQRFEKMIQNVEQRLAERDQRYNNPTEQQSYQSPPRSRDQQVRMNLMHDQSPNGEIDEAIMKTQYKHQVTHNEWKYRQLLQGINHHEIDANSPMISGNNFVGVADKPSISFHQLKSKYGNMGDKNRRVDSNQDYEDLKEEMDQDFFKVPEENEEEPQLRLRVGQQMDTDHSPVRIEKIDLHKYIQSNQGPSHVQYPQFNRNHHISQKSSSGFGIHGHQQQEHALFSQIENHDLSRQDDQKASLFLSQSPSKNDLNRVYIDLHNQQTLSQSNALKHDQRTNNHKTITTGQYVNHRNGGQYRQKSTDKNDFKNSIYKYNEGQSRVQQQSSNTYKRTSSQSPWRMLSDDQDSHTIVTPVKEHQPKRHLEGAHHQTVNTMFKSSKPGTISGNYSKPTTSTANQISPQKSTYQPQQYTPGKGSRGKDSSIGRTNPKTMTPSYAQTSAQKRKRQNAPVPAGSNNQGVVQSLYSRHQQQHQTIDHQHKQQNLRY